MDPQSDENAENGIEVVPLVVLSRNFPARPSAIPEIREFVLAGLARSPLTEQQGREVGRAVLRVLLEAAGRSGAVQISFRISRDRVEVDVLRSEPAVGEAGGLADLAASAAAAGPRPRRPASFAGWMADALRRAGMTREDAARQLGVSVKTVGRWIGGETEPRLRDLRRIQDLFGEVPFP
ncbi:helix-turn-helix transcriptional regulator [Actinospica sp. MGRD01-02]|uniref:Helix-turn-helix transcriptional regulator n=1 Tax=Actinospica acidithermotolerans TaxID=2828514 RepID=A0A941IG47_9ACTN|nr:helix-turn-helix transcriptional regulator [Actinospica acidithermotolerans]MBR7827040.1 helix-turn-helix transcriptional regulator [Actinospica acidithermotolerans]